jgi:hypothetical protein
MSRIPHYGRFFRRHDTVPPGTEEVVVLDDAKQFVEIGLRPTVDWRSLSWPQLRSLAASLTDDPIRNREDAERAVKAKYGN